MENQNKYYTPDISELFNDFEYEYFQGDKWNTEGFTIYSPVLVKDILDRLKLGMVRVKYLDSQDIEECGFNIFEKESLYSPNAISYHKKHGFGEFYIEYIDYDYPTRITYKRNNERFEYCMFEGFIKNKSELKKLLKQLGIYEKTDK